MISLFISCDVPLIECSIWSRRVVTLSFPELSAGWLSKVKNYDRRFENEIKYVRVDIIQLLFMFFAIIDRVKPFFDGRSQSRVEIQSVASYVLAMLCYVRTERLARVLPPTSNKFKIQNLLNSNEQRQQTSITSLYPTQV